MVTVLCTCRVADYDTWRVGYDRALEMVADHVRSWKLWRSQDDPNLIAIIETFDSREIAEPIWMSAETKAAMEADGIDMSSVQIEFLDEVEAG
jgi:hypothetical protein